MTTSTFTTYGTPNHDGDIISITFSYDTEKLTMTKSAECDGRVRNKTVHIDQDAADALDRLPADAWTDAASIFGRFDYSNSEY